VILSRGDVLAAPLSELSANCTPALPEENTLHHMERKIILGALRSADGRLAGRGGAAEVLGLKRTTLQRKMQRLGIEKADYALSGRRQNPLPN
jgi:formate hydrogenlyase transcriptional activator